MVYLSKNSIKHMNLSEFDSTVAMDIMEISSNPIRSAFSNFENLDLCSLLDDEVHEVKKPQYILIRTHNKGIKPVSHPLDAALRRHL